MPISDDEEFNVERLVDELIRKKEMLDRIIGGLERDTQSEDQSLATAIHMLLQEHSGPIVDLPSDAQSRLLQLANNRRCGARGVRAQQSTPTRRFAKQRQSG